MGVAVSSAPGKAPRRRRIFRVAMILLVCAIVVVVGLGILVTSQPFIKGVVLPRVGDALNARVTAARVALRPSSLTIDQLVVHTTGAEPLATVGHVRAEFRLGTLLSGKMALESFRIDSPKVHIVENADGTSNLDPLLE